MTTSRKDFIKQSSFGAAALLLRKWPMETLRASENIKEISLIINVLQREMRTDWKGTLKKVADIGYSNIEFDSIRGVEPAEVKSYLKEIGLRPLAAGTVMAQMLKEEQFKKTIDDALFMGKEYIVCYWPWRDGGLNKKLDDFKKTSEDLNWAGEQCKKGGIKFAYHNHDKEFVPVEGYEWGYEVLLKNTDPKLVCALMDLYWVTMAGGDPVKLFKKFPKRFELLHVKDMDNTPKKGLTCPGYGVIDFAHIFSNAKKAGVKHFIVEIDRAENPIQCITDSYQYLHNLRF